MIEELAHMIFGPIGAVTAIVVLMAKAMRKPAYSKVRDKEASLVLTRVKHGSKQNIGGSKNLNDDSGNNFSDFVIEGTAKKPSKGTPTKKTSGTSRRKTHSKEPVAMQVSKDKPKTTARSKKTKSMSKSLSSGKKSKKAA